MKNSKEEFDYQKEFKKISQEQKVKLIKFIMYFWFVLVIISIILMFIINYK
jgi:hypothetical protein